ncbi:MAG: L-serine ammonia-lyase [Gammaproteobacteria bacterium]|nr:L-serine ammonia-lyase [Gammaproteobacteria bacterium]
MSISVFEMFKVGVGPSSSHTVGPMRAARDFVLELEKQGLLEKATAVVTQLYGSLALTGVGHGTDKAVLLGLTGAAPDTIDPDTIEPTLQDIAESEAIELLGKHKIDFDRDMQLLFIKHEFLDRHSNGMRLTAFDGNDTELYSMEYFSIGGGFIVRADDEGDGSTKASRPVPHDFSTAEGLLAACRREDLAIHELVLKNELAWRDEDQVRSELLHIWKVMDACIERGMREEGVLPGGLEVQRRAPKLYRDLQADAGKDNMDILDWVNLFALAVNEENAAGGRIVTAPTNGAAGIIPAVLRYYVQFIDGADDEGILRFLLTAGAIGTLYKKNAGISGAEMGCQGEVGVACSMAAGGLMAALKGSNEQIENAAEIGMEHNLGLTCDPVAGLVQIPCIERNAMGALKAINAARMARRGDGQHKVSLDQVISTMRQTGRDMQSIYKETSLGGLAVNVPEC